MLILLESTKWVAFMLVSCLMVPVAPLAPVRVTFLTDCTKYSHWMSLGMQFSFKMSGQPGKVTRVACCTDKEKETYPEAYMKSVDTWIAPSLATHPTNGDHYPPYNKPEAVIDYLLHNTPEEEYILVLDSDMTLRRPFLVEEMNPSKGMAIGASYTYMIGVANELAPRHIPEIAPRNDSLAGPVGRLADQVGGFFFIHRDDLKRMSTLWLKYTEDVRFDDMAWKYSGDVYATRAGAKPWISEMYGYAFGAAKADVWHTWDSHAMIYPGYTPEDIPKVMHYGLNFKIGPHYSFDKHRHYGFDASECPPWILVPPGKEGYNRHGIHPHPPRHTEIQDAKTQGLAEYYRDVIAIEMVNTINAGLCEFHMDNCPPSYQLAKVCREVWDRYVEIVAEVKRVEIEFSCADVHKDCESWAKRGECSSNADFMRGTCKKACNMCRNLTRFAEGLPPASQDYSALLAKLEHDVATGKVVEILDQADKSHNSSSNLKGSSKYMPPPTMSTSSSTSTQSPKTATSTQTSAGLSTTTTTTATTSSGDSSTASPIEPRKRFPKRTDIPRKKELQTDHQNFAVHCYRQTMPFEEVKECIRLANEGKEYQRPEGARILEQSTTGATTTAGENGGQLAASQATQASSGAADAFAFSGAENFGGQRVVAIHAPVHVHPSALVLAIWLIVVAACMLVLPRIFRRFFRKKSGLRTE